MCKNVWITGLTIYIVKIIIFLKYLYQKKSQNSMQHNRNENNNKLAKLSVKSASKEKETSGNSQKNEEYKKTAASIKEITGSPIPKRNLNNALKVNDFLNLVHEAIKLQKVFMIGNQNKTAYPAIRNALITRGWIEKCSDLLTEEELNSSKMTKLVMNILKEAEVNFIWVINGIDFGNIKDDTIVNRFPKNNNFTTKVGLCRVLEEFHWFYEINVSKTITPRTFKLVNSDDIDNFIKEFGLNACVCLMKIVANTFATADSDYFFRNGTVPISIVDFANTQCSEYVLCRQHGDVDRREDNKTTAKDWNDFLFWFYMIAHKQEHFQTASYPIIQAVCTMSKRTLKKIKPYWPQFEIEGSKNLWVVKPAAQQCGRGIRVMQNLEDIIDYAELPADKKPCRYIVQKYIERPYLIYNTKFDIRQWFMITSVYPLVIWIYKDCYLRFSSQPFLLENCHESIHLTNNAIQRNYKNNSARDHRLPEENMWHCSTFQKFLKDNGESEKWNNVIVPGIKEGIVGAVLASQDEMVDRQNSFELYGADFLLGTDYTPILLEINRGPAMSPSTKVTAELCRSGLEDIIKVVIDRKNNPQADTGKLELLYKQEIGPKQRYMGIDLMICGRKMTPAIKSRHGRNINKPDK